MIKIIKKEEIPQSKHRTRGDWKYTKDIKEFLKSRENVCECLQDDGDINLKKACSVAAGYVTTVRRMKAPVKVIRRKERIFLIREDLQDA